MTMTISHDELIAQLKAQNQELQDLLFQQMETMTKATHFLGDVIAQKSAMTTLTETTLVHYVAYNGRHLAAMVIGYDQDEVADLVVFTNMEAVTGRKNFGMQFHQEVPHLSNGHWGGWHYVHEHEA